jgi:hypothetical protein
MGLQTIGTIFNTLLGISKAAAAVFTQAVQRAVTEQATESCGVCLIMTGKIFTFFVLKNIVIWHNDPSL